MEFAEAASEVTVGFRSMTHADLPDVVRWQQAPHAARWFRGLDRGLDLGHDIERAQERYGRRIDGIEPTRMWVVEIDGRSVGYVQDYLIGDHPEYAILTAEPDAIGVDYVIGESSLVGRGIGTRVLRTFLRDVVRPHCPDATKYVACPDHRNVASLRVLEKLGFAQGLWFDEPQADGSADTLICCTLDVRRLLG